MHPAAVGGFIANLFLTAMFHQGIQHPEALASLPAGITPEQAQIMARVMWWVMGFQAAALVLIMFRQRAAIPIAVITGILMLPIGFFFLAGCLLSQANWVYAPFAEAGKDEGRALAAYPFFMAKGLSVTVIFLSTAGALLLLTVNPMLGFFLISCGAFCMYLGGRLRHRFVLALYDGFFTYTGGLFAKTIKIPYAGVRTGSLLAEDKVGLEVMIHDQPAPLVVSVANIRREDRRAALDALGRMLVRFNVPLT